MELLTRASQITNKWVERSLASFGITMAFVVALQVFCRYILNHSLFWSEELARYLLVWLTFLGATAAYYRRIHPGIDILTLQLNQNFRKLCRIVVHLVSLTLFVVMIYHGIEFAYFIRGQISPALAIPKWIIFIIIPICGAIFLLHCFTFVVAEFMEHSNDR
jgi:TRAP-type C4-dicarboxylate transport system permease small subunit